MTLAAGKYIETVVPGGRGFCAAGYSLLRVNFCMGTMYRNIFAFETSCVAPHPGRVLVLYPSETGYAPRSFTSSEKMERSKEQTTMPGAADTSCDIKRFCWGQTLVLFHSARGEMKNRRAKN